MSLADRRAEVELLVRHAGRLSQLDLEAALLIAGRRLSGHVPQVLRTTVTVQPGGYWLSTPARWIVGVSRVQRARVLGAAADLPADGVAWTSDGIGEGLLLAAALPEATVVTLWYSTHYLLSSTADEIPVQYQEAVAHYAAAICCRTLASLSAGSTDSTIAADTVDWRSAAGEWRRLAADYEARYYTAVGVAVDGGPSGSTGGTPPAAGVVVEWDTAGESGGTPLLHRRGR